jgi:hypothetical protein
MCSYLHKKFYLFIYFFCKKWVLHIDLLEACHYGGATLSGRVEVVHGEGGSMAGGSTVDGLPGCRLRGRRGQRHPQQCGASLGIREWTVGSPAAMNPVERSAVALFPHGWGRINYF